MVKMAKALLDAPRAVGAVIAARYHHAAIRGDGQTRHWACGDRMSVRGGAWEKTPCTAKTATNTTCHGSPPWRFSRKMQRSATRSQTKRLPQAVPPTTYWPGRRE